MRWGRQLIYNLYLFSYMRVNIYKYYIYKVIYEGILRNSGQWD